MSLALAAMGLTGCLGYPRGVRACAMRAGSGSSTVCAFGLPGVRASATDVPGGVELRFSAVGDGAELRRRVHDVIEGSTRAGAWHLPPEEERVARKAKLSYADGSNAVIVVARAIDVNDIPEIRAAVHERLDEMRSASCD